MPLYEDGYIWLPKEEQILHSGCKVRIRSAFAARVSCRNLHFLLTFCLTSPTLLPSIAQDSQSAKHNALFEDGYQKKKHILHSGCKVRIRSAFAARVSCRNLHFLLTFCLTSPTLLPSIAQDSQSAKHNALFEDGYQKKKHILHSGCKVRIRSAFAARVSCWNLHFLLTFCLTSPTLLPSIAQDSQSAKHNALFEDGYQKKKHILHSGCKVRIRSAFAARVSCRNFLLTFCLTSPTLLPSIAQDSQSAKHNALFEDGYQKKKHILHSGCKVRIRSAFAARVSCRNLHFLLTFCLTSPTLLPSIAQDSQSAKHNALFEDGYQKKKHILHSGCKVRIRSAFAARVSCRNLHFLLTFCLTSPTLLPSIAQDSQSAKHNALFEDGYQKKKHILHSGCKVRIRSAFAARVSCRNLHFLLTFCLTSPTLLPSIAQDSQSAKHNALFEDGYQKKKHILHSGCKVRIRSAFAARVSCRNLHFLLTFCLTSPTLLPSIAQDSQSAKHNALFEDGYQKKKHILHSGCKVRIRSAFAARVSCRNLHFLLTFCLTSPTLLPSIAQDSQSAKHNALFEDGYQKKKHILHSGCKVRIRSAFAARVSCRNLHFLLTFCLTSPTLLPSIAQDSQSAKHNALFEDGYQKKKHILHSGCKVRIRSAFAARVSCRNLHFLLTFCLTSPTLLPSIAQDSQSAKHNALFEDGYQKKKHILHSGCKVRIRSAFAARVSCRNLHFLLTFCLTSPTLLPSIAQDSQSAKHNALFEDGYQKKKHILHSGCKVRIRSAFAARVSCRNLHFLLTFCLTSPTLLPSIAQDSQSAKHNALFEDGYQKKKHILHSGCKVRIRSAFAARVSCRNLHFLLTFCLTSPTLLPSIAQDSQSAKHNALFEDGYQKKKHILHSGCKVRIRSAFAARVSCRNLHFPIFSAWHRLHCCPFLLKRWKSWHLVGEQNPRSHSKAKKEKEGGERIGKIEDLSVSDLFQTSFRPV